MVIRSYTLLLKGTRLTTDKTQVTDRIPKSTRIYALIIYRLATNYSLLEIIDNSDRRHGLKFDCNQEATLVRGAGPLIRLQFKFNLSMISSNDPKWYHSFCLQWKIRRDFPCPNSYIPFTILEEITLGPIEFQKIKFVYKVFCHFGVIFIFFYLQVWQQPRWELPVWGICTILQSL